MRTIFQTKYIFLTSDISIWIYISLKVIPNATSKHLGITADNSTLFFDNLRDERNLTISELGGNISS